MNNLRQTPLGLHQKALEMAFREDTDFAARIPQRNRMLNFPTVIGVLPITAGEHSDDQIIGLFCRCAIANDSSAFFNQ